MPSLRLAWSSLLRTESLIVRGRAYWDGRMARPSGGLDSSPLIFLTIHEGAKA